MSDIIEEHTKLEQRYAAASRAKIEAFNSNASAAEQDIAQAELAFARMAIADKGGSTYGSVVVWPTLTPEEYALAKFPGTHPTDIAMRLVTVEVIAEFLATQKA